MSSTFIASASSSDNGFLRYLNGVQSNDEAAVLLCDAAPDSIAAKETRIFLSGLLDRFRYVLPCSSGLRLVGNRMRGLWASTDRTTRRKADDMVSLLTV